MERCWRTGLAMLAASVMLAAGAAAQADAYADRLLFADGLYVRGMHDLAIKEYTALLNAFPAGAANDAAMFRLAECLRLQGDRATAGRFYSHVVVHFRESPFRLRAAYRRARLYADEDDHESAVAHYQVILQENPPPDLAAAARFYLGESLQAKGDTDAADAAFAAIEKEHPESEFNVYALMKRAEIRRDRWAVLYLAGDAAAAEAGDQALAVFDRALKRGGPDRLVAEALFQTAEIHFRHQAYAQSADVYRQLLKRFPNDTRSAQALLQAAWSAVNTGLYAEALEAVVKALADPARAGTHDEWLYIKANCERQLLQHETAIVTYRELLVRFPPGVLHLEAGIQSFDPDVLARVNRRGDLAAAAEGIAWLVREAGADVHADLIAGLPGEAPAGFAAGFDRLYRLGPSEIQVGILKSLYGTALARDGQGARFRQAPPYDVIETPSMMASELDDVRRFASHWDRVVNRGLFPLAIERLLRDAASPWQRFDAFSRRLAARHGLYGMGLVELATALLDELTSVGVDSDEARGLLRADYLDGGRRQNLPALLRQGTLWRESVNGCRSDRQ